MKSRLSKTFALIFCLLLAAAVPAAAAPAPAEPQAWAPGKVGRQNATQMLQFIANAGQLADGARYQVQGSSTALFLADDAIWITLFDKETLAAVRAQSPLTASHGFRADHPQPDRRSHPIRGVNLKISFVGASARPVLEPFDRQETRASYFRGAQENWRSDVAVWGGVRYRNLYPGVDLELSGAQGRLAQRIIAQPWADLSAVRLRVEGAQGQRIEGDELRLTTEVGELALPLLSVQTSDGQPLRPGASAPSIEGAEIIAPFAHAQEHTGAVAPQAAADLSFATYVGGMFDDEAWDIAIDGNGASYITGNTFSPNFPTTSGAWDTSCGNDGSCDYDGTYFYYDAFITKINAAGTAPAYSTFIGGNGGDFGEAIAVDSNGAAYITGYTFSSDFPVPRAHPEAPASARAGFAKGQLSVRSSASAARSPAIIANGTDDIFIMKLNPSGTQIVYTQLLYTDDPSQNIYNYDEGYDIAVDANRNAYVTGLTGYDSYDGFVAKLDPNGTLIYGPIFGGSNDDWGSGIAVDGSGNTYITGRTVSTDYPLTNNAYDSQCGDDGQCDYDGSYYYDMILSGITADGQFFFYSTYLGGNNGDAGFDIAVDGSNRVYVTGYTYSTNFVTTSGAHDRTFNGLYDAFAMKLNFNGSPPLYSTFLGSSSAEYGRSIAVDNVGNAYITGKTFADGFPTTLGAYDETFNGASDAFVSKLNGTGGLTYSTFLGGSSTDQGNSIAVLGNGASIFVAGLTSSGNFPVTNNTSYAGNTCGADPNSHSCYDVFVAKISPVGGSPTGTRSYLPLMARLAAPACDPFEPNNDRKTNAVGIQIDTSYPAKICANDDEDNYYFDLQRNAKPTITLDLPTKLRGKTSIWLYDQLNLDVSMCGYGGSQVLSRIVVSACPSLAPGRYIVRIYTDNILTDYDNVNPYTLLVTT